MPFDTVKEEKTIKIRGEFRIPGILDETIVVEVPQGTSLDTMLRFVKEVTLIKVSANCGDASRAWITGNTFYYKSVFYKVEYILEGVSL